jgi:hypothetical protein
MWRNTQKLAHVFSVYAFSNLRNANLHSLHESHVNIGRSILRELFQNCSKVKHISWIGPQGCIDLSGLYLEVGSDVTDLFLDGCSFFSYSVNREVVEGLYETNQTHTHEQLVLMLSCKKLVERLSIKNVQHISVSMMM